MPLKKGKGNSGIKNLISFPKGRSGYSFRERTEICIHCTKPFKTNAPFAKYCSSKCKEGSRPDKQKKEFICEFCGKHFKRRAPNNAGRFCSRECSGLWITANGQFNYFYKAFLNLPHKCNECGNDDFTVLVVHHKNGDHSVNELENLEILCANCHYRIHFGNGNTRKTKIKPILDYLERIENESTFERQKQEVNLL